MKSEFWLKTGIVLIILSIILGAFGAHALKEMITADKLQSFETGVKYQMYHGLGFLLLGILQEKHHYFSSATFRLLFVGIVLFSVSIYVLALSDYLGLNLRILGPITPLGGLLLIAGWGLALIQISRKKKA